MATLGTSGTNIGSQSFSVGGYGHTAYIYAKLNHQSGLTSYIDLELRINYSVGLQSYDTDFYLTGYGGLGYAYREGMSAGTYTIMSSSITVGHDSNGNASFAAQGGYEYKGMGVSATTFGSSTYSLPKITVNYTVTYNANGGSGQPGNQTKVHGTNLTLSSTKPSGSGHTFKHGNTAANGSGTSYNPGGTYSTNANVTLYAQGDNETYTITYNANGGDGAPDTSTKVYGSPMRLSTITPTRAGYTFFRGNTASDGTGQDFSPGGLFGIDATTTLYAIGIPNGTAPTGLFDCYTAIKGAGQYTPCFIWIKVGSTGYFVKKTAVNVGGTWKTVSNKG